MMADQDRERFLRQIMIDGFGENGQQRLSRARVLVAGAGGLGCAVCTYLAAAGTGLLRVVDRGEVELSNLNRQVLYATGDIGKAKAPTLQERLRDLNPGVLFEPVKAVMDETSLPGLLDGMDAAVDALDNLPARLALNKACVDRRIPLVHGAVNGFQGQVMTVVPGQGPCLMCLYEGREYNGEIPVLGTSPGITGCIQATEVIKILTGLGAPLSGRLLLFDGREMRFSELAPARNPRCPHCGQLSGSAPGGA
ncbi:MAG: HesA/MoeB/ThiF family protein [Spirochaetia bacterium]